MKLTAILPVRHLGLIMGALTLPALTLSAQSAERSIAAIPANTAVAIRTIAIAEHEATATSPIGLTAGQTPAAPASPDAASTGPLIPVDTVVAIRTVDPIDSDGSAAGKEYRATVDDSVVVAGVTVAPVGTPAFLRVVQVQQAGAVKGRAVVSLKLSALEISGQRVSVETGGATIRSGSQSTRATKAGAGGAIVGGILGGLLGGKGGAAQGVAAGAAVGVTAAAVKGQKVHVPAETRLSFTVTGSPTAEGRPDPNR
jgi:hypothetical protein